MILLETTVSLDRRALTGHHADVYHVNSGKITEHSHLSEDRSVDEEFYTG